jgi:hypothetical protein
MPRRRCSPASIRRPSTSPWRACARSRGRPCDAVAAALAHRLDDSLWQRRAWAARILGANDCAGSRRQLVQRLTVEPDLRVQAQLKRAIDSLKEPGA